MKILHLIPTFGSGGAERQLSIIAPALAKAGVECHVGYCQGGQNLAPLLTSPVRMHQLKVAGNHDPRLFWQVLSLIREIRPDVVQTWLLQMDIVGGLIARLTHIPYILSERSSASAYPPGWKTRARSGIGLRASTIVANSQGGVDYWRSFGANVPIHLIRNCITPAEGVTANFEDISPSTPLVLFAGRLSPEKNVNILFGALVRVLQVVPACIAVMFGEGPMHSELTERISEMNMVGRIRLGGFTPDLAAWMNRADVCVSISNFEGNPNVVLEAAAQGCPLVLSDIPAHREIFDDTSAWFVKHTSVNDVSNGILQALREKEECSARVARARQAIAGLTLDAILNEYLTTYADVMKLKQIAKESRRKQVT